jgi:hypothetical protein
MRGDKLPFSLSASMACTGTALPFLQYLLTYSMEQSPSLEANNFTASQEISLALWNPKVHYGVHKSLPPFPILGQIKSVHAPIPSPEDPS